MSTFHREGLSQHDFSQYSITATKGGVQIPVDLNESSRHYLVSLLSQSIHSFIYSQASVVELKLHEDVDLINNSVRRFNFVCVPFTHISLSLSLSLSLTLPTK